LHQPTLLWYLSVMPDSETKKPSGERAPGAVLRDADVRFVRELYSGKNISLADLARNYGVDPATIRRVVRGETYRGAGGPVTRDTSARARVFDVRPCPFCGAQPVVRRGRCSCRGAGCPIGRRWFVLSEWNRRAGE
jgi:hypothetical protein